MAKKINGEYLKKLFELVGPGASKIKDWTAAAELVDESMEISRSSGARYQVVISILKSIAFTGPESPIEIIYKGTKFDTITIKNADEAVKKFFGGGKKKSPSSPVKPEEKTTSRPEVSDTEAFFICFKAVRAAVRINGGVEGPVEIKMSSLIPSCKRGDKEFTFNEIVSAIEKTSKTFKIGLEVSPNIAERKLTLTGANKALKNMCEIGANAFSSYTCFNVKDAFGHTFDKVFAAPKKETSAPIKNVLVFTDEERDRIFHIGGHLNEVGCQSYEDIQSYLSHLGKDCGASKLEALVRQVPEFKVEGNMVFLTEEWDKFRKTYRLLDSSNKEQVIIKIACSEEWVRGYLGSCQVKKIDSFGNNINIFRVDVPVESVVAKENLISLIEKFREGEGFYSETRFSKWLEKQWKKTRFEERIKSDTYRFEIGYFEKKRG